MISARFFLLGLLLLLIGGTSGVGVIAKAGLVLALCALLVAGLKVLTPVLRSR